MTRTAALAHTAPELIAQARAQTGIGIDDTDIAETLEHYVRGLNTEAELHAAGAKAMEWHILQMLMDRLRMLRDFRAHPEIAEQRIERPLIMSGAARTGSTKLHKMLGASGDFKWMPCWQGVSMSLLTGERDEDPAQRIHIADQHIRWFNDHAPNAKLIHEFSTHEPEEEVLILAHLFYAPEMIAFSLTPRYMEWYLANHDPRTDLAFHKKGLQYLQWQFHDGDPRPWILKSPLWPGHEPIFTEMYPGATFASTHREPVATMSSGLSLLDNFHVAYSSADRKKILGPMMLEGLSLAREFQMATLDAHPDIRSLDIGYSEVTKNAEAVIEKIYAHTGMTLSERARQAMHDWEQSNTQHKLGAHQHSLEDFGLTADMVTQRSAKYISRYHKCI